MANSTQYVPSEQPRHSFSPSVVSAGVQNGLSRIKVLPDEPEEENPDGEQSDAEILREAHEHFQAASSWEASFRERARKEFEFVDGLKHWDSEMLMERKGRPCLTFDRIGPACDQVVNDARQAPPEPKLSPVGEGADKETAEVLQGLVRNIENDSNARVVWATGYEHAVKVGRGWVRVLTEYEDDESDRQKIVLKRVANPFSVYPDPAADEFDYSDMRKCLVTEDLEESVYKETYPDSRVAGLFDFQSVGDAIKKDWFPTGTVRVAEYWKVVIKRYRMATLEDGQRKREEDVDPDDQVRSWREVEKRIVKGYKLNGAEILKRWDWMGKWIPIVPIIGREVIVEGKRTVRGMVRPAMDANLSYDYMRSKEAEAIGLAPLSQWLVAENQIENYANQWAASNRMAFSTLTYKPTTMDGPGGAMPVPPPIRISPSVDTSAISQAIAHAEDDVRATTSSYRPDMGESTPDQSGRAILAIQRQGDNAHFNYHDNLAISQMHVLRIIVDLAPKVYDERAMQTIFDPDGSVRQVMLNQEFTDLKTGLKRIYDIKGAARYDVTIGSGPSYASRRAQAQDQLMQLVQAMPQQMAPTLDLVLKTFDIPGIAEIADRVRPPGIAAEQDGQPNVPASVQLKMAQMQQMIQQQAAALKQANDEREATLIQNDSRERIAAGQDATNLMIADLKLGAQQAQNIFQSQYDALNQRLQALQDAQMQRDAQAHQAAMGGAQGAQDAQAQREQQQHEAGLQAGQQGHEAAMAGAAAEQARQLAAQQQPQQNGG